jgi:Na+-driven multidrug efflux pump
MHGWDGVTLLIFMIFGGILGVAIAIWVATLIGFLGEIYKTWQDGRKFAQIVTEKEHKRRLELLAKMIELERAMQPVPSEKPVIEGRDGTVNEPAAG